MTFIKRIRATIVGNLDSVIGQIENQDAVVDAIIHDARQALAAAKVRLARVDQDASRMQSQQTELERAIAQWTTRATNLGNSDKAKALACLSQRKTCSAQHQQLTARLAEHKNIHQRLAADVKLAETRLSEILDKQHLMRTRESAAKAMRGINTIDNNVADDLAATFERWDMKVTESELMTGLARSHIHQNALEQEFLDAEAEAELQQQLAELLAAASIDEAEAAKENNHE